MRNTTIRQAFAAGFGIVLGIGAMAAPSHAYATTKVPGSCDLVQTTACGAPTSLLDAFLALFR